ncbi:thioesterase family protein [Pseudoalteromonas sp. JBTF-M23]|uniref:Medium/long-chain acyl-CoA thioesterase YigI n=1 Tax=Pseudoalteromonas caenipelagi TaxID=2726988 RepID=A0A849VHQ8_9GAMM|nr:thioesterase family protein [Pseudoalteromonas caenipelagi]NOU52003.1 thioesterase family protein [Pseudoalteromonas caenipelagi]
MDRALLISQVGNIFVEKMPFNRFLGISIKELNAESARIELPWQDEFIGNPTQKILHGGVISAVLDNVGGMLAAASIIHKLPDEALNSVPAKLATLGTIDIRTDFLRPGRGEYFIASATLIRSGNKVCVCRMELHNQEGVQIAFGTGTYLVG